MPDMQSALFARISADAAIAADLTAGGKTRIHWVKVPQTTSLPYVRLQTISDPRPQHLQDYDTARVTRVQVDVMALSYTAARRIAENIVTAVAQPATVDGVSFGRTKAEGPRDLGEDVDGVGHVFRLSMDLLTEHTLA